MIEKLADRLVDVDLLNRAATLLDHQVRFRLQGEDRAKTRDRYKIHKTCYEFIPINLNLEGSRVPNLLGP